MSEIKKPKPQPTQKFRVLQKLPLPPLAKDIVKGVIYALMIGGIILFSRVEETTTFIYSSF